MRALERTPSLVVGALSAALIASSQNAAAQEACQIYTVKPGETLASIAEALDLAGGVQLLQSANFDILVTQGAIGPGTAIRIPCADGTLPELSVAAATATPAGPVAEPAPGAAAAPPADTPAQPSGSLPPIRFLTGGNFAPFVGDDLPEGGLFVALVEAALAAADPTLEHSTVSIFDWDSHLETLLPTGAFDLGFPWHMPDCAQIDDLSDANRLRCTDYDRSEPFFEAVIQYYVLGGSPLASADGPEDLVGARICRPSDWFTFDLEQAGLVEPAVTMVYGAIPTDCWRELQEGRVDLVTYDALAAGGDIARLGLSGKVIEIPGLQSVATMHVIAPRSDPNGRAYLDLLDRGLAELRADGRWFEIVARHLSAYNASLEVQN